MKIKRREEKKSGHGVEREDRREDETKEEGGKMRIRRKANIERRNRRKVGWRERGRLCQT